MKSLVTPDKPPSPTHACTRTDQHPQPLSLALASKKAIPKKSTRLIQISENQKHHTNPHCPHQPFGPPSVVSLGTSYAHVALVWCIRAHHTPPGHQVSGMRTSGQQVPGIIPLSQFIGLNFGPFCENSDHQKLPKHLEWVPLRSFSSNKTPCLEVSGHKNSTETKHLGPHELSSIATKSRGVSEFFLSGPHTKVKRGKCANHLIVPSKGLSFSRRIYHGTWVLFGHAITTIYTFLVKLYVSRSLLSRSTQDLPKADHFGQHTN